MRRRYLRENPKVFEFGEFQVKVENEELAKLFEDGGIPLAGRVDEIQPG